MESIPYAKRGGKVTNRVLDLSMRISVKRLLISHRRPKSDAGIDLHVAGLESYPWADAQAEIVVTVYQIPELEIKAKVCEAHALEAGETKPGIGFVILSAAYIP